MIPEIDLEWAFVSSLEKEKEYLYQVEEEMGAEEYEKSYQMILEEESNGDCHYWEALNKRNWMIYISLFYFFI